MKKKRVSFGQNVLTFVLGLYALICLLPLLLVAVASFTSDESLSTNGFTFFPESWSLKAWEYVFGFGRQLVVSYGVTIFVTLAGTIMSLLIMSMFAYTLSRSSFMLRKVLTPFVVFTMLFSGGQLATYMVYTTMYGLRDSMWALIFPGIGAMNIIIMRTYIKETITESLIESAKIDGASEFRTFSQIVFPLMKPTLAAVGFRLAVGYWNDWQKAYLYISSPDKTPLQLLLIRIEKNIDFVINNAGLFSPAEYATIVESLPKESGRMAILLAALGPIMIAYPFFQKYFVEGMTMGAVKE